MRADAAAVFAALLAVELRKTLDAAVAARAEVVSLRLLAMATSLLWVDALPSLLDKPVKRQKLSAARVILLRSLVVQKLAWGLSLAREAPSV